MIAVGFGLRLIYNLFTNVRYKTIVVTVIGFLVVLILTHGVSVCLRNVSRATYFRNAYEVMVKVKQFMDEIGK